MRYLLLIYGDETDWEPGNPVGEALLAAYPDFSRAVEERGVLVVDHALHPTSTATTVRVRDGETLVTDGPFAETREQLGGFYLLDCADLDEALAWAARIPDAARGCVEVRPVMEFA